jgi:hypothetical protein
MPDEKTRIVVMMEGGLIHNILSSERIEVLVLDADTEGADEDRIQEIVLLDDEGNPSDMREENYVSTWDVPGEPNIVEHYFKQVGEEKIDADEVVPEVQEAAGKGE